MPQGPTRGDFRNGHWNGEQQQKAEEDNKEAAQEKPKSDRWSHDGYDQMMKVQEKNHRHRGDSRPQSMTAKVFTTFIMYRSFYFFGVKGDSRGSPFS